MDFTKKILDGLGGAVNLCFPNLKKRTGMKTSMHIPCYSTCFIKEDQACQSNKSIMTYFLP